MATDHVFLLLRWHRLQFFLQSTLHLPILSTFGRRLLSRTIGWFSLHVSHRRNIDDRHGSLCEHRFPWFSIDNHVSLCLESPKPIRSVGMTSEHEMRKPNDCFLFRMNFFGLLNFQAPYLPWVLFAFSLLLGNSVIVDLMGIVVGHIYYFLEDVFPREQGGFRLLKTPRFL